MSNLIPRESEISLARQFADTFRQKFRWSRGLGWHVNRDTHWAPDHLDERYEAAKQICKQAARGLEATVQRKICSGSTVRNVLDLVHAETDIATRVDAWDRERHLLNTPAGLVDLRDSSYVTRRGLYRQITAVGPDFSMPLPIWNRFLETTFNQSREVIDFMQRLAGYCLTGEIREQKLFFLHGGGGNGKSVLLNCLQKAMGMYAYALPSAALMRQKNEQHPTLFAGLMGRRMALSSEIEDGAYWAESRIKELTGDEKISARFMRKDFFEFSITHKHLICGNYKPRLRGDDPAMARRMILIPFDRSFAGSQRDPHLLQKLQAELPGVLAWAIEGARIWYREGLSIPDHISRASDAYMREQDDISGWVEDCCIADPSVESPARELYRSYSEWKLNAGEHPQSERAFAQRLERQFKRIRKNSYRGFSGIQLRPTQTLYSPSAYEMRRERVVQA